MSIPRLRMISGANGSGKSTLFQMLISDNNIPLGYCLNPDLLNAELRASGRIEFSAWGLKVDEKLLRNFFSSHPLAANVKLDGLSILDNALIASSDSIGGYFAAILSDLMRRLWLASGDSFTFETVMSSPDKVVLLQQAVSSGYRAYLYFVCTDSAKINEDRIANRVLEGGHDVPSEKIRSRYDRSLALLPSAIRASHRAYLFDNSGGNHKLIAEFSRSRLVNISQELPDWYVLSVLSQPDLR